MSLPSVARANVRAGRSGHQSQWRTSPGADNGPISTAILLAKRAVKAFGKGNVVFMGHSLGGGLASAAMLTTGAPGVTFNTAGLSDSTLRSLKPGKTPHAIREELAGSGQIRRYNVEGALLMGLQGAMLASDAVGHMSCALPRPEALVATLWNCMAARAAAGLCGSHARRRFAFGLCAARARPRGRKPHSIKPPCGLRRQVSAPMR